MSTLALAQNSTIVRFKAPTAARVAFAAAQAVGTTAAAALLERFFLTPRRSQLGPEEQQFLRSGRAEAFDSSVGRLATWSWGEGRTVLLMHGWGSRAARFRAIAPALVAAGYRVVAFDAPGHGLSVGRMSSLPETARAIRSVVRRERERRGAAPFALIAHSFGCAASILAQRDGPHFERNVMLAPATDFDAYMDRVAGALGITPEVVSAMIARVERRLSFSWQSIRIGETARGLGGRALIFHDPADAEVPFADAELLTRSWPGSRLQPVHGLGHRRLLYDDAVIKQVVAAVAHT